MVVRTFGGLLAVTSLAIVGLAAWGAPELFEAISQDEAASTTEGFYASFVSYAVFWFAMWLVFGSAGVLLTLDKRVGWKLLAGASVAWLLVACVAWLSGAFEHWWLSPRTTGMLVTALLLSTIVLRSSKRAT